MEMFHTHAYFWTIHQQRNIPQPSPHTQETTWASLSCCRTSDGFDDILCKPLQHNHACCSDSADQESQMGRMEATTWCGSHKVTCALSTPSHAYKITWTQTQHTVEDKLGVPMRCSGIHGRSVDEDVSRQLRVSLNVAHHLPEWRQSCPCINVWNVFMCVYVCVCMHVCMYYVCMYICMYVCMYTYIHTYTYIYTRARAAPGISACGAWSLCARHKWRVCVYTIISWFHIHTYECIYMLTSTKSFGALHTYIHTYTHTYVSTNIAAHIHLWMHVPADKQKVSCRAVMQLPFCCRQQWLILRGQCQNWAPMLC